MPVQKKVWKLFEKPSYVFSSDEMYTPLVLTRGLLGPLQLQFSIFWLNWPLQAGTDINSHMGICKYHFITPMISVQHVTASAYFHRCVLCREYLIDVSVKGQYVTIYMRERGSENDVLIMYIYIYIYIYIQKLSI